MSYSQWIADVSSIGHEKKSPFPEGRGTPLLQLIRTDVRNYIIGWLQIARQDLFVSGWLAFNIFFLGQTWFFAI
jgi:hypothetical protein